MAASSSAVGPDDGGILDLAEKAWQGTLGTDVRVESFLTNTIATMPGRPGVHFACTFANVTVLDLPSGGLALIDCGTAMTANVVHRLVRAIRPDARVEIIVYTHGHADHVMGAFVFDKEATDRNWPKPTVYAHRNLAARFDRYKLTRGYNEAINRRQFRTKVAWPSDYRYPDVVYDDELRLVFERHPKDAPAENVPPRLHLNLYHGKGETDDATWVYCPEYRLLCTGDMFIWVTPNCGNPQKVQRYPLEWAQNLRRMIALEPALLLPGHGPPIVGASRVQQALTDTAVFLEDIVHQTVALLNTGIDLDTLLQQVKPNTELLQRPYLAPVYDEPQFIVRNLWRLYGGWWSGSPEDLKPSTKQSLAIELAGLIPGGYNALTKRARELSDRGEHALASHVIEFAFHASNGSDAHVLEARRDVYKVRADTQRSLMSGSIFRDASLKSAERLKELSSPQAKL